MEILLWVKFFPQPLMNASSPPEVKLPWLATLSLFSLWGMLFFAVSEDRMAALRGGESMSASHDSSSSLLDADGSAKHVDVGGVGDGNGRVTNSVTSGRGNAATDRLDIRGSAYSRKPHRLAFFSSSARLHKGTLFGCGVPGARRRCRYQKCSA